MAPKINTQGMTRVVFVFNRVVIKVPNPLYGWVNFLTGIIANYRENYTWKYHRDNPKISIFLCPVLWCSWGGLIVIMQRADVERHENELDRYICGFVTDQHDFRKSYYIEWEKVGFGKDQKPDNYGYIGDRLVKVDYGN